MTKDQAAAALAAMAPENRIDVENIAATPYLGRHVAFARVCHARGWTKAWADHVWEVADSLTGNSFDDDIPF